MALVRDATERLATRRPDLSARRLETRAEGAVLAAVLFGIAAAIFLLLGPPAIAAIEILAGLVFLATILLRMQAISVVTHRRPPPPTELPQVEPESLPVYSILLPVYREPHMLAELVGCMERLVWPREKLDIKPSSSRPTTRRRSRPPGRSGCRRPSRSLPSRPMAPDQAQRHWPSRCLWRGANS